MRIEAVLLGRFEVRCNARVVEHWQRSGAKRLFKLLALAPQQTLPAQALMQSLWPHDLGDRRRQRLHHLCYLLRRALEETAGMASDETPPLVWRDGQVSLRPTRLVLDTEVFWKGCDQVLGAPAGPPTLAALLQVGALYTGSLLPGDIDEPDIDAARTRLEQRHLALLHATAQMQRRQALWSDALATLQQIVQVAPADETAHRLLIETFAKLGQRAQAEQQYLSCKAALRGELGIAPQPQTTQAYRMALQGASTASAASPVDDRLDATVEPAQRYEPPTPLVPLIDRDRLVEQIRARLADPALRLLSLTGVGGLGKTQLALRVGHELRDAYRHGVCFVSLAETDGRGVLDRLRRALRITESPAAAPLDPLVDHLRTRHLLLVCDNCEHVQAHLGVLTELLSQAPALQILATSRRRLNLRAEQVLPVPPLSATPESAVRLFVERARAADPAFIASASELEDIQTIARQLDGLPLSIELVAARAPALGLSALRDALSSSLSVVAGGGPDRPLRHRSLRSSVQWSRSLLSSTERHLLDRAALFAAPFEAAALLALCADLATPDTDLGGALQTLQELGLLRRAIGPAPASTDAPRLIPAEGACERIRPTAPCHTAFVAWYTRLAQQIVADLGAAAPGTAALALARFDADHENFFAALHEAERLADTVALCTLVQALCVPWARTGAWARANAWAEKAQTLLADLLPPQRAAVALSLGAYWHESQVHERAQHLAQLALTTLEQRTPDDLRQRGRAVLLWSSAAYHRGDAASAMPALERTLHAARQAGDHHVARAALNNLATSHLWRGELVQARHCWSQAQADASDEPPQSRVAFVFNLALVAHYSGQHDLARQRLDAAEQMERSGVVRPARLVMLLIRRCWMACCRGDALTAQQALSEARTVARQGQLPAWLRIGELHEGKVAVVTGQLERAAVLLDRQSPDDALVTDPWEELDRLLWLFWARFHLSPPLQRAPRTAAPLQRLVSTFAHGWHHEHARILEAAAAWLLASQQPQAAAQAFDQARAWRSQGFRRFDIERAAARSTQVRLRGSGDAAAPPRPGDLSWLVPWLERAP